LEEKLSLRILFAALISSAILPVYPIMAGTGGRHYQKGGRYDHRHYQHPQKRLLFHKIFNV